MNHLTFSSWSFVIIPFRTHLLSRWLKKVRSGATELANYRRKKDISLNSFTWLYAIVHIYSRPPAIVSWKCSSGNKLSCSFFSSLLSWYMLIYSPTHHWNFLHPPTKDVNRTPTSNCLMSTRPEIKWIICSETSYLLPPFVLISESTLRLPQSSLPYPPSQTLHWATGWWNEYLRLYIVIAAFRSHLRV